MLAVAINVVAFYLGAICLHRYGMAAGIAAFVGVGFPGTVIGSLVEYQLKELVIVRWGGRPVFPHGGVVPVTLLNRGDASAVPYEVPAPGGAGTSKR